MKKTLLFSMLLLTLSLTACGGESAPETLKVAVLPILDALPMHVALEKGYFSEQNLEVELVPVNSGPDRDQLMQAGQVDAMINELVSVIFYNQNETQVVVVRFARTATDTSPVFRILAAADKGIESVEDLAGVEIGISEGTVIAYTTDRILENAGLSPEEIATVAVPRIPDRLNLLQSGELSAANLPDPVASLAILNGAVPIIDDSSLPEVGTSVISFSVATIEEKPNAVSRFLAALERAVEDLNQDPSQFMGLLAEKGLVPPPLLEGYQLPSYVTASVPSEAQWQDALDWTLEKGLIGNEPAYDESVDASYLP
jgi:NitT/TauT family transport system substrate-binding protein